MNKLHLFIGNKTYSSWSLRPWLAMKYANVDFEETVIPLYQGNWKNTLLEISPVGTVPVLTDRDATISDSLAILEYIAELYPEANLLPSDITERARLRSVCAEMHAGFNAIRSGMPMNTKKKTKIVLTETIQTEVTRIIGLWSDCLQNKTTQGPFLFGHFTLADAMYAPVASRFNSYGVELNDLCNDYSRAILELPAMKSWYEEAAKEEWVIPAAEI